MRKILTGILLFYGWLNALNVLGCGPEFDNYSNIYMFGCELLKPNEFAHYYYDYPYGDEYCGFGDHANLLDWQQQFPQVKNLDDIEQVIYKSTLAQLDSIGSGKNPFPQNAFAALLPQHRQVFDYLYFAKRCEPHIVQPHYGWEQPKKVLDNPEALVQQGLKAYSAAKNLLLKQRYAFQVIRLTFYQKKYKEAVVFFDQLIKKDRSQNHIYYRALLQKAGALRRLKQDAEANYLFAIIADQHAPLHCIALKNAPYFYRFYSDRNPSTTETWAASLAMAKNDRERAAIWVFRINGDQRVDVAALREIFRLDPQSPKLDALLFKQLKWMEVDLFVPSLQMEPYVDRNVAASYGQRGSEKTWFENVLAFLAGLFGKEDEEEKYTYQKTATAADFFRQKMLANLSQSASINDMEQLLLDIGAHPQASDPALYRLMAAYLEIMKKDFGKAKTTIAAAKNGLQNPALMEQADYLLVLASLLESPAMTPQLEQLVTHQLHQLLQSKAENAGWKKLLFCNEIGRRYLKQNDLARAILAFNLAGSEDVTDLLLDVYATVDDLEKLAAFTASQQVNDFDKLLIGRFPYSQEVLREVIATRLARDGQFEQALQHFRQIKKLAAMKITNGMVTTTLPWGSMWKEYGYQREFVVLGRRESWVWANGCHTFYVRFPGDTTALYDKHSFLERMVKLQQQAQADTPDEAARIYQAMAETFEQTPFWCYNVSLWQCEQLIETLRSVDSDSYPLNLEGFAAGFHARKQEFVKRYCIPYQAVSYYEKAAQTTTSREFAAKMLFRARMVIEKEYASYWMNDIEPDYDRFFRRLKAEYADTEFYVIATRECSRLEEF